MIYDASDPLYDEKASVSIPGIDRMLIVGNTPTALEFSSNITQITSFDNMYQSKDIEGAVEMLKSVKVSIVIIDGDSDFDPVSCSRLIRIQNSLARIILISTKLDHSTIINLKNNGIIHGFILLPCVSIMAHTIIVQEQAKYHINQTLKLILIDPPSGTPLYRRLKQSPLSKLPNKDSPFYLIAISIVHETISVYNQVIDQDFDLDPILFSSYFSAISIFSEKIINTSGKIESFEFNEQVVFVKSIDNVQYIFVLRDVTEENRKSAETVVSNISQKLYLTHGEEIKSTNSISDEDEVGKLIHHHLPSHQKQSFLEAEKKAQIINIHEPNSKLASFYDETSRVYEIQYVDNEDQLFDMINDTSYEVVIFNNFASDFQWNKYLLNIVKDESPFTQSIAIVGDMDNDTLSNILNVNDLDLIIDPSFSIDQYYATIKKAIDRSKSIQDGIIISDLNRIYRLRNNPELLKAMLRKDDDDVQESHPHFYLMYIMVENEKFYSYYAVEDDNIIAANESLFFGFIDSLLKFTDELDHSPLMLSGIKYGKSNIIVKRRLEYYFIYFIGDLDYSNFDLVNEVLAKITNEIYEVIRYDVNPHVLSDGLGLVLDEISSDINLRFENMNT